MKKIIIIFITIMIIIFSLICYMTYNDNKYIISIKKEIGNDNITYVNKYDDKYIVCDKEYVYLYDDKFMEIFKISLDKIYDNKNNYDIIYRKETLMYMDDNDKSGKITYNYYDLYTYKLIETISVGG